MINPTISPAGTSYIQFGDDQRMYEILETRDQEDRLKHNYELRVDNSPNDTFAEFSVSFEEEATAHEIFSAGFRQAEEEVGKLMRDPQGYNVEGLQHVQDQIRSAAEDWEFIHAVENMQTQDKALVQ